MGVEIPSELNWLVQVTAGQDWPKPDEDKLGAMGRAWADASVALGRVATSVDPVTARVLNGVRGAAGAEFSSFMGRLGQGIPAMSRGAGQVGRMSANTGLQVGYAKYMIIAQTAWLAAEIAALIQSLYGAALVPAQVAAVRWNVQMILRRAFTAVITETVAQAAIDAAVQGVQFLMGVRAEWDTAATIGAVEMGAISGAIAGPMVIGAEITAPKLAANIVGMAGIHATTGVTVGAVSNAAFDAGQDLGLAAAAGAIGGAAGWRRSGHGGAPAVEKIAAGLDDLVPVAAPTESPAAGGHGGTSTGPVTEPSGAVEGSAGGSGVAGSGAEPGAAIPATAGPATGTEAGSPGAVAAGSPGGSPAVAEQPVAAGAPAAVTAPLGVGAPGAATPGRAGEAGAAATSGAGRLATSASGGASESASDGAAGAARAREAAIGSGASAGATTPATAGAGRPLTENPGAVGHRVDADASSATGLPGLEAPAGRAAAEASAARSAGQTAAPAQTPAPVHVQPPAQAQGTAGAPPESSATTGPAATVPDGAAGPRTPGTTDGLPDSAAAGTPHLRDTVTQTPGPASTPGAVDTATPGSPSEPSASVSPGTQAPPYAGLPGLGEPATTAHGPQTPSTPSTPITPSTPGAADGTADGAPTPDRGETGAAVSPTAADSVAGRPAMATDAAASAGRAFGDSERGESRSAASAPSAEPSTGAFRAPEAIAAPTAHTGPAGTVPTNPGGGSTVPRATGPSTAHAEPAGPPVAAHAADRVGAPDRIATSGGAPRAADPLGALPGSTPGGRDTDRTGAATATALRTEAGPPASQAGVSGRLQTASAASGPAAHELSEPTPLAADAVEHSGVTDPDPNPHHPLDPEPGGPEPDHVPPADTPPAHQPDPRTPELVPPPAYTDPTSGQRQHWEQAQRGLYEEYDARLDQAARTWTAEAEVRTRLDEAFTEWSLRLPDGTPDQVAFAVRRRAGDLVAAELAEHPAERDRILQDLPGRLELAGFREAAVRVGMERFDRVADSWGHRLTSGSEGSPGAAPDLPPEALDRVRTHMAAVFRERLETAAAETYRTPSDVRGGLDARTALGEERLASLTGGLTADLDLRAGYEAAVGGAERMVDQAAVHWRTALDPVDATLLEQTGVTSDAQLSEASHTLLVDRLRDGLAADFAEVFGSAESTAEFHGDLPTAVTQWNDRFASRAEELPGQFALQAAREATITAAVDTVRAGAETWAERGRPRVDAEAAEALGIPATVPERTVDAVAAAVAAEADQRLMRAAEGDPVQWAETRDGLTDPARIHDLITLQSAREQAVFGADAAARAAAAAPAGGRPLSADSSDRVREAHAERVRTAFDEIFPDPDALRGDGLAERLESWRERREALDAELTVRAAFESEVVPGLEAALRGFDRLAEGRDVQQHELSALREEFGEDWFTTYREHWGPAGLDRDRWLAHEAEHEGRLLSTEAHPAEADPDSAGGQLIRRPPGAGPDVPLTLPADVAATVPGDALASTGPRPVDPVVPPSGRAVESADHPSDRTVESVALPSDASRLPTMGAGERTRFLVSLSDEERRVVARDPEIVDGLYTSLPPREFARVAADLMVAVDPRTERPVSARQEARDQLARMLQDPDVARRMLLDGAGATVVPRDVPMTEVPDFRHLAGRRAGGEAGGGRGWDEVRGSGALRAAVTEENLLGEHTTVGRTPSAYPDGYSTTTHEFAHTIHDFGLTDADRGLVSQTYRAKIELDHLTSVFGEPSPVAWSDGVRQLDSGAPDIYAARNEREYFAQVTNAYLGTNHGTDPFTGGTRNNGPQWVRQHEPELLPLLERLYGPDPETLVRHPEVAPAHVEALSRSAGREATPPGDRSTDPAGAHAGAPRADGTDGVHHLRELDGSRQSTEPGRLRRRTENDGPELTFEHNPPLDPASRGERAGTKRKRTEEHTDATQVRSSGKQTVPYPEASRAAAREHAVTHDGEVHAPEARRPRLATPTSTRDLLERSLLPPTLEQEHALQAHLAHLGVADTDHRQVTSDLLAHVNPNMGGLNCVEANLALWDLLDGAPRVAGTLPNAQPERHAVWVVSRTLGPAWHYGRGLDGVERVVALLREAGPLARALLLTAREDAVGHVLTLIHEPTGSISVIDPQWHVVEPYDSAAHLLAGRPGEAEANIWAHVRTFEGELLRGGGTYDESLYHASSDVVPLPAFGTRDDGTLRVFRRSPILTRPEWRLAAERFERTVAETAHFLTTVTGSNNTVTRALFKLRSVLHQHFEPTIDGLGASFTKEDVASAGQVGRRLTVYDHAELLESGNPREKFTALYNALYYNSDEPGAMTFKAVIQSILARQDWAAAERLGLDVEALRLYSRHMGSTVVELMRGATGVIAPQVRHIFDNDPLALGRLSTWRGEWRADALELAMSQIGRRERSSDEQLWVPRKLTPRDLLLASAELSGRELAFLERNAELIRIVGMDLVDVPLSEVPRLADGRPDADVLMSRYPGAVEVKYTRAEEDDHSATVNLASVAVVVERRESLDLRAADLDPEFAGPEFPLQSIEGRARFEMDENSQWVRDVQGRGFPMISGVSGTTTRMLSAYDWLNVPDSASEEFLVGLISWMVPARDHSLYEVLRGAQLAGFQGFDGRRFDLTDAVSMYRTLDALGEFFAPSVLRARNGGLMPDEEVYLQAAAADFRDQGFIENGPVEISYANDLLGMQLSDRFDPDDLRRLLDWLGRNGTPISELRSRITPAHVMAIMAYTGSSHQIINFVVESTLGGMGRIAGEGISSMVLDRILGKLIDARLKDFGTEMPALLMNAREFAGAVRAYEHLFTFLDDEEGNPKPDVAEQLSLLRDEMMATKTRLLPQIIDEARVHADMLISALQNLPAARDMTVWRGDWAVTGLPVSSMYSGDRFAANTFASASRDKATALNFASKYGGAHTRPVVLELALRGGSGRDIDAFSLNGQEEEVLMLPNASFQVTGRDFETFLSGPLRGKNYELIQAEEVVAETEI